MTVSELIPVLQTAIGPVVLISGVGLLVLSLTNRLGRVIDRGRILAGEMRAAPGPRHPQTEEQLHILSRRARLLQRSIFFSILCVLFAAILIITIAAGVLTPGQDPFSMLLLAIPMILLYELGILMIHRGKSTPVSRLAG